MSFIHIVTRTDFVWGGTFLDINNEQGRILILSMVESLDKNECKRLKITWKKPLFIEKSERERMGNKGAAEVC